MKFLSLEPLLGPIPGLDLPKIGGVIVGGESGPGARPMQEPWVVGIRNQCQRAGAPFFFKQWGEVHKKKRERVLQGWTWIEVHLDLEAQQGRGIQPSPIPMEATLSPFPLLLTYPAPHDSCFSHNRASLLPARPC